MWAQLTLNIIVLDNIFQGRGCKVIIRDFMTNHKLK